MPHLTTAVSAAALLTTMLLPHVAGLELPRTSSCYGGGGGSGGGSGSGRRQFFQAMPAAATASLIVAAVPAAPAHAAGPDVRKYTALAPLGPADATTSTAKRVGMPLSTIASELAEDLAHGHTGRGGYFVSSDIDTSLFSDTCRFVDPTNDVASLSRYQKALTILFDPTRSTVKVLAPLTVDPDTRTIRASIESQGTLKLPWTPRVKPYQSEIVYRVGDEGLIVSQEQTWSISPAEALRETFTPSFAGPPVSVLPPPPDEPKAVTALFDMVNGRRAGEGYTEDEQRTVERLIEEVAGLRAEWAREDLPGLWHLAYLTPGPDGTTVDRRIPFPEYPWNDSYQLFTTDSVKNIGEVMGPLVKVLVGGSLREDDTAMLRSPKRFVASINSGRICVGGESACAPLPIK